MNEKNYKKRLDFQQTVISKKSEEIESLKLENEKLKQKLKEKDEIIPSVEPMRKEMTENVKEHKRLKNEYQSLIQELRQMKKALNKEVFKNRWWLVKLLIK
jgi:predicted RNase H-like nuclease (RuvC/YqgF family)